MGSGMCGAFLIAQGLVCMIIVYAALVPLLIPMYVTEIQNTIIPICNRDPEHDHSYVCNRDPEHDNLPAKRTGINVALYV